VYQHGREDQGEANDGAFGREGPDACQNHQDEETGAATRRGEDPKCRTQKQADVIIHRLFLRRQRDARSVPVEKNALLRRVRASDGWLLSKIFRQVSPSTGDASLKSVFHRRTPRPARNASRNSALLLAAHPGISALN
jgi:hypothetical protein